MGNSLRSTVWSRSREMLALAAGVAGHELRLGVRSKFSQSLEKLASTEIATRVAQAELVADRLGRLKGAFMKAGQLLSIDASDLLPPEAVAVLAKLQGQVEPVDFQVMRLVLVEELGADKLARLEGLGERAEAAASIGQVHRACVDGTSVAVKIQYPGIAESIDSDLALVQKLASSWLALGRRDIELDGTFEELRTILHLEADYDRERAHLDRFGELLRGDSRFVVPRSLPELSTRRVLTMTWEDGMPLGTWLMGSPSRAARYAMAEALLDLYCLEFFSWGLVQTDPNFGNFLVRGDEGVIVLLDFGATLAYDESFRAGYVGLLRRLASGDARAIVDAGIEHGLLDDRESEATRELFVEMLHLAVEPFVVGQGPFVFSDADYAARSRDVVLRFVKSLRFSPPPRQLLFLHRKLGGLFQLCKRLDVAIDLRPTWNRMVA